MAKSETKPALRFRVDPQEKAHVDQAAKDAGFDSTSSYLRPVCLTRTVCAVNGGQIVVIPPANSSDAHDAKVTALLEQVLAEVQNRLAGEGSPAPAPTSQDEGGRGDEPPHEPPGGAPQGADAAAGSPGPGETSVPAPPPPPSSLPEAAEGLPAVAPAAGVPAAPAAPAPAAPAPQPLVTRFPADTAIPEGLREIAVAPNPAWGDQPGDFWLGQDNRTGEFFVAVVVPPPPPVAVQPPAVPPAQPPAPPAGEHPFEDFGGQPAPGTPPPLPVVPPPAAPPAEDQPQDPGPSNEHGENFAEYVDRRAGELQREGRSPVVAQQEAAAEWRKAGHG